MNLYLDMDRDLEDPRIRLYADDTYRERFGPDEDEEGTFDHVWERWDD